MANTCKTEYILLFENEDSADMFWELFSEIHNHCDSYDVGDLINCVKENGLLPDEVLEEIGDLTPKYTAGVITNGGVYSGSNAVAFFVESDWIPEAGVFEGFCEIIKAIGEDTGNDAAYYDLFVQYASIEGEQLGYMTNDSYESDNCFFVYGTADSFSEWEETVDEDGRMFTAENLVDEIFQVTADNNIDGFDDLGTDYEPDDNLKSIMSAAGWGESVPYVLMCLDFFDRYNRMCKENGSDDFVNFKILKYVDFDELPTETQGTKGFSDFKNNIKDALGGLASTKDQGGKLIIDFN